MTTYAPHLTAILDREPVPAAGIVSHEVDYEADGVAFRGYLARPGGEGRHPGILVVHDWLGVTDYVRMRCDMLARLGYVAFAADVYGADVRPAPDEAAAVAGGFYQDRPLWRARLTAAFARMRQELSVDPERTAAIGYCFGGSSVLELARTGADVDAVVSFHGGLLTGPAGEAEEITAKILVLHGAADPVVPTTTCSPSRTICAPHRRGLAGGHVRERDARVHASGCRRARAGSAVRRPRRTTQLGGDEGVSRGGSRVGRAERRSGSCQRPTWSRRNDDSGTSSTAPRWSETDRLRTDAPRTPPCGQRFRVRPTRCNSSWARRVGGSSAKTASGEE